MALNIPAGTACFIDANIFYYHYVQTPALSDECTALLRRAIFGEIAAYTTTHVLAEAIHKIMLSEAVVRHGLARAGLVRHLESDPEQVKALGDFRTATSALNQLNLSLLPVDLPTLVAGAEVSQRTGLLTNDAIIVAVMEATRLTHLITNDGDFDTVPGLTVWKPR